MDSAFLLLFFGHPTCKFFFRSFVRGWCAYPGSRTELDCGSAASAHENEATATTPSLESHWITLFDVVQPRVAQIVRSMFHSISPLSILGDGSLPFSSP